MGAVRIYKEQRPTRFGSSYPWQVRSNGCTVFDPIDCGHGYTHEGVCNAFNSYEALLRSLNSTKFSDDIGAYLNK